MCHPLAFKPLSAMKNAVIISDMVSSFPWSGMTHVESG